ncbi:procyclic form-specific polypeptide-like [Topomyia yanbarensis]|uniref:procyclic form-specific polypeptide-like n=1 Tax=Topomyia yanbarensis TaxID=2498891 RepID=UPI00273C8B3D|nr:procyclic form-specific polypeptide-like [Topomyia yanbarensis]
MGFTFCPACGFKFRPFVQHGPLRGRGARRGGRRGGYRGGRCDGRCGPVDDRPVPEPQRAPPPREPVAPAPAPAPAPVPAPAPAPAPTGTAAVSYIPQDKWEPSAIGGALVVPEVRVAIRSRRTALLRKTTADDPR